MRRRERKRKEARMSWEVTEIKEKVTMRMRMARENSMRKRNRTMRNKITMRTNGSTANTRKANRKSR